MDNYSATIGSYDTETAEEVQQDATLLISATPTSDEASVLIQNTALGQTTEIENNTEYYFRSGMREVLTVTVTNGNTEKVYTVTIDHVYIHRVDPTY